MLRSSMKWLLCCIPACTLVRPLDDLSSERPEPPFSEPAPYSEPTGEVEPSDDGATGGASGTTSLQSPLEPEQPEQPEQPEDFDRADAGASLTSCTSDIQCPEGRCVEAGGGCQPCPPEMSLVRFADGIAFCIDRRETTQREYDAFLASVEDRPDISDRPRACTANASFTPRDEGACSGVYRPAETPDLPVTCVDACDALAYCIWAGKRLCGKKGGGQLLPNQVGNPTKDEWLVACNGSTSRLYPYGGSFDGDACVVASDAPAPVGTEAACVSAEGVFDLSGNVAEWSDSSDNSSGEVRCAARGGSFANQNPLAVACQPAPPDGIEPPFAQPFLVPEPFIGIRCCAN